MKNYLSEETLRAMEELERQEVISLSKQKKKTAVKKVKKKAVLSLNDSTTEQLSIFDCVLIEKAKDILNDFIMREFKMPADFSDISRIAIASTISNENNEISVYVNLKSFSIDKFVNDQLVERDTYESLQKMIDTKLENLVYSELIYVSQETLDSLPAREINLAEKETEELLSSQIDPQIDIFAFGEDKEEKFFEKPVPIKPIISAGNYRIEDDFLGIGSNAEKIDRNIKAIRLIKEKGSNPVSKAEQDILAQYIGWGGLPGVFDESSNEYRSELKTLLSSNEYTKAKESTLTAFYTPPLVIKAIYKKLAELGFKTGNILEPSCGTGNFFGLIPESMKSSKLYGVEIDEISGQIAKKLYPENNIEITGFEKTTYPDNFFDAAIGNIPFGDFKVYDKKYQTYNFKIHDYFFAKALDKVRIGGIVAFITSKGTMDKTNSKFRAYISKKARLLGAVRLPDNTFTKNAGTKVTADILFLQKTDKFTTDSEWINTTELTDSDGEIIRNTEGKALSINEYFVKNPHMVLGKMEVTKRQYGREDVTCKAYEGFDLEKELQEAFNHINGVYEDIKISLSEEESEEIVTDTIPAEPDVKNFSFTVKNNHIWYREDSKMTKVLEKGKKAERIVGLIEIREVLNELIQKQVENAPNKSIKEIQKRLNAVYDTFVAKNGLINSRGNSMAFSNDSSYPLLCSLEILDNEGNLKEKAPIFKKRTIGYKKQITSVETASEALAVSLAEYGEVDINYMQQLCGKSKDEVIANLKGVIFNLPETDIYVSSDEYLSGNVRKKLQEAEEAAIKDSKYDLNVAALKKVQPEPLSADEIGVRLGTTWIDPKYIKDFIIDLLEPSVYTVDNLEVTYEQDTWGISKTYDYGNVKASNTYGTSRIDAYKIIEKTLNQRDIRIYDYEYQGDKKVQVLNKRETMVAQQKQELIKESFNNWIWKDPERRNNLTDKYNKMFNSVRPREYDGSHLHFNGMSLDIELAQHQKDAVARILYGGNTLLAHVVGAGKTFTMIAAAMESKRIGLSQKALFVVPNHLIQQFAADYMKLYPTANLLIATKKDFTKVNRRKFCSRIATGEWDGIIMGQSQFSKIPMSLERQQALLENQLRDLEESLEDLSEKEGNSFSVKQISRTKKKVEEKLAKLYDTVQDNTVNFEELGIDMLFIDEAHYYKNLFLYTKMSNVGGISQTEAKKSSDLFMKCLYLNEVNDGRGIVFATGTPISNSMVEMYTMQRYLQHDTLESLNLLAFDSWASTFGETVTAIELAPEGTGYRSKTRFSRFYNLPELINIFKEVADIKTADMLSLPVPKAIYHTVSAKPSEEQKQIVKNCSERAERIRNGNVDSSEDNMLLVTNDGKKAAIDQRVLNDTLPDYEDSKLNLCIENTYDIWKKTEEKRLTQLIFCDMSTPDDKKEFDVYNDIRKKLIYKGVPESEIAFIHDANTDKQKEKLFEDVRCGKIRVLIGSTFKMGAGTNVQNRLIASHDLDCPWRPADLEQRSGRIVRQGNQNEEVHIFRYVTESTFDAYLWQLVENKQRFISQIMTGKAAVRSAEDVDDASLSYAEIKALAAGNPEIKEKMELDIEISKLKTLKSNYLKQRYKIEDDLLKLYPKKIADTIEKIKNYQADLKRLDESALSLNGEIYTDKREAGKAIYKEGFKDIKRVAEKKYEERKIGTYRGFELYATKELRYNEKIELQLYNVMKLKGLGNYFFDMTMFYERNIKKIDEFLNDLPQKLKNSLNYLEELKKQKNNAENELKKPFDKEDRMAYCFQRVAELNTLLEMDNNDLEEKEVDKVS